MEKRYKVVFLGLVKTEDYFKEWMSRLGMSPAEVERIIMEAPVILKEDMTIGIARRYADDIMQAGGKVNIEENGFFEDNSEKKTGSLKFEPLESFTMCPRCGHKQLKSEQCVKCGLTLTEKTQT
jgi:ribosomal protein L37E